MAVAWDIQTPPGPGAVAVLHLTGTPEEIDATLGGLGIGRVPVARVALRDLMGIDRAIVARWNAESVLLMPHGGAAVVRALAGELQRRGLQRSSSHDPALAYPEASGELEARMLDALARAASPLAIDLLLDQPRRWRERGPGTPSPTLARLIDPPLVVAVGPPNIGKSSLVNALAGRAVAIVADQPGTTRDHVGVRIDMAGLVVRYVDTPGLGFAATPADAEAASIARGVIAAADLILSCGDRTAPPVPIDSPTPRLTIATRADLGPPAWAHDLAVSALTGAGLPNLVAAIRESLVPASDLASPVPWRFW